jgi:hypothetical protein
VREIAGPRGSTTTTQEDTMTTDSYARTVAVDGAARPTFLVHEGISG